jgi:putative sterol carrier protein
MSGFGTVHEYFTDLNSYFVPAKAKKADFSYWFEITGDGGGDYTVTVKEGTMTVTPEPNDGADTHYRVSAEHYLKIINGQMNGRMAVLTGKMKVNGNIKAAMAMQKFLPPGQSKK